MIGFCAASTKAVLSTHWGRSILLDKLELSISLLHRESGNQMVASVGIPRVTICNSDFAQAIGQIDGAGRLSRIANQSRFV